MGRGVAPGPGGAGEAERGKSRWPYIQSYIHIARAGKNFTIAHRCLYAEFVKCRIDNKAFSSTNTINRAMRLIHSRLKAYGKACKDFCNERQYKRKNKLPLALSERRIIKVKPNGQYKIHEAITSYTYLINNQ